MVDLEGAGTKRPPYGLGCIWEGTAGRVTLIKADTPFYLSQKAEKRYLRIKVYLTKNKNFVSIVLNIFRSYYTFASKIKFSYNASVGLSLKISPILLLLRLEIHYGVDLGGWLRSCKKEGFKQSFATFTRPYGW